MLFEKLFYLVTFIITTGISAISILLSYQLVQTKKKPVLQLFLYQQIFLFSYFIYGIWGNLLLRLVISDTNMAAELSEKLTLLMPALGLPFLLVSWFMLLKFGFNLNGCKFSGKLPWFFLAGFILMLVTVTFLFQNNFLPVPQNPNLFQVRLFVSANLFVHLILFYPFFFSKTVELNKNKLRKNFMFYFFAMIIYSGALWFYDVFGFISASYSIILLFAASAILPFFLKFNVQWEEKKPNNPSLDFDLFCREYEISKREAEIILEICSGKTNKAIAEKLFITLQTVKDHTHRIYSKTRVKSRVQLTNLVREEITAVNKKAVKQTFYYSSKNKSSFIFFILSSA